jgi:hypothetical protein
VLSRLELKQAAGNISMDDIVEINRYLTPQPYEWLMPEPTEPATDPLAIMPEEPETLPPIPDTN